MENMVLDETTTRILSGVMALLMLALVIFRFRTNRPDFWDRHDD